MSSEPLGPVSPTIMNGTVVTPASSAAPAAVPAEAVSPSEAPADVPVKTVAGAQAAFAAGDAAASKALHEGSAAAAAAKEAHGGFGSDYVKSIVFGGLDGVITTFSTIASSFGGAQTVQVVITLAVANLIADAISMGVGDFLSSHAEYQYLVAEKGREAWECALLSLARRCPATSLRRAAPTPLSEFTPPLSRPPPRPRPPSPRLQTTTSPKWSAARWWRS